MGLTRAATTSALAILCWFGVSRDAWATPTARLVYLRAPGAESCPREEVVRAAVTTRLGYDPFRISAPSTLLAEVERHGDAFTARVRMMDETSAVRGTRKHVHHGDCADIIDAVALTISIAIDPESLMRAPGTPPEAFPAEGTQDEREATPATPPLPDDSPKPPAPGAPPARAPDARSASRWSARVEGVGWVGAAPGWAWGIQGGAEVAVGRWSLSLEARADLPASRDLGIGRISTSYLGGALVPCVEFPPFHICAVASAGRVHGKSDGVASPREDDGARVAVGPRLTLSLKVYSGVLLVLSETVLVSTREESLTVAAVGNYRLSRVAAGTGIGIRAKFF